MHTKIFRIFHAYASVLVTDCREKEVRLQLINVFQQPSRRDTEHLESSKPVRLIPPTLIAATPLGMVGPVWSV